MALKKVTKTIPLSGGLQDEAPEFLLEPPGMAYIENARFRKQDLAEKTEPITYQNSVGTSHELDPFVLHRDGDTLVTVGNDVAVYDGTSWITTPLPTAPRGIEKLFGTTGEAGGSKYTWAPFGIYQNFSGTPELFDSWLEDGYCVAFEVRNQEAAGTECGIHVQRFTSDGVFLDETVIDVPQGSGFHSPILQPTANIFGTKKVALMFLDSSGYLYYDSIPSSGSYTGTDGYVIESNVGGERHQATYMGPWGGALPINYESRRVGWAQNATWHSSVKFKMNSVKQDYGVVAWKSTAAFPTIWVQATDLVGAQIGTAAVVAIDTASGNARHTLLDVDSDDTYLYVLYAEHDTTNTNGSAKVYLKKFTKDAVLLDTKSLWTPRAGTVLQGSCKVVKLQHPLTGTPDAAYGDVVCAWTFLSGDIDYRFPNTLDDVFNDGVNWVVVPSDFGSITVDGTLNNHRLASNIEVNKDGLPIVVVQQFQNATPYIVNTAGIGGVNGSPTRGFAHTYVDIKPVTSVLVQLGDNDHTVLGVFDPGQSKCTDASHAEQSTSYGNLYYIDSVQNGATYWKDSASYGNRVALTGEDFACYLPDLPTQFQATTSEGMQSTLVGESRFAVYRVSNDIPIRSTAIGKNFILNSALPLWYANGVLSELSIIDQPEIVAAEPEAYESLRSVSYSASIEPKTYKALQPVVGYFDQGGVAHRSAPGFPLYLGSLGADNDWNTNQSNYVKVTVSKPLSYLGGRGLYFAEVYAADPGGEPQLACVIRFDPNQNEPIDPEGWLRGELQIAVKPSTIDWDHDIIRQSETLYTTGNVLPSDPWPNIDLITTTSRRMFASSLGNDGVLYYSKLFEEGLAPEFSAPLVISLGTSHKITALGTVDDKVIIFERDRMHILYGRGPDNTGANGDFFVERIQSAFGCEDQDSLVTIPDGLIFYSSVTQEFHMVNRDLVISDIGKPVIDLSEGIDIIDTLHYPAEHEVRFYVSGGGSSDWGVDPDTGVGIPPRPPRPRYGRSLPPSPVLVYNYHYQKWTVLSDQNYTASTIYNNKPAHLNPAWALYEMTGDWTDSKYMVWETPWIKVNQLQDYGRFWDATILGKYLSDWKDNGNGFEAGDLKITVKYDYEGLNGDVDEYLFRANVDFDPTDGERLQFKVKPGRQKCQAIKFIIEEQLTTKIDDAEPDYTLGRGFELDAIDLVYGAKGGSSRSFGRGRQK